ncbi:MAG: hypothetical protein R3C97_06130 [Geminicoccaceae bacterium]
MSVWRNLPAAALLPLLFLVSCAGEVPREPPQALPEVQAPVRADPSNEPSLPTFCPSLARLVDAMDDGFASLRANAIETNWRWHASLTPSPFVACEIEGTVFPSAIYRCESQSIRRGQGYRLDEEYGRLQAVIDECLRRTSWYPRDWRKGDPFSFAGAEKQIMWRDVNARPVKALVLGLEESLLGDQLRLVLTLKTLR